jgi:hypothetical protein
MPIMRRKSIFKTDAFGITNKKNSNLKKEKTNERGRNNPNKIIKKNPIRNPNKKK